jgi:MFS family permease
MWLLSSKGEVERKRTHRPVESTDVHMSITKWVENWYISYALLGLSAAGLLPILLPLLVERTWGAADIGFVMAAFSLGGLTAPFWGGLADRYRLHRWLLVGGILGAALGAAVFPFASLLSRQIGLALLSGVGLASAATVATLFIVEAHPKSEWDARIGWLQTFYGSGQVIGLVRNAVTALSGVIGAVLGGWGANLWGYVAIPIMGIIGAGAGLIVLTMTRFPSHPAILKRKEAHR